MRHLAAIGRQLTGVMAVIAAATAIVALAQAPRLWESTGTGPAAPPLAAPPPAATAALPTGAETAEFWLRKYVEQQVPLLQQPGGATLAKADALREWAFRTIDTASAACLLENRYGTSVTQNLAASLQLVLEDKGGFYCGGTANVLAGLYRLFGFEAYAYNMGQPEGPSSHVVTLVMADVAGKPTLIVEDALLNYTLEDHGQPVDAYELLDRLAAHNTAGIEMRNASGACKPFLIRPDEFERSTGVTPGEGSQITPDGFVQECINMSLASIDPGGTFAAWLRQQLPSADSFLYLYLFPIGTAGGAGAEAFAAAALRAQSAAR